MDLNVQSCRIFCKVVEKNCFSSAARELKLTQPTVSQQIRRIENYLGYRAFERVGRGIHLTLVGQQFYEFAQDLVERTDEFAAELSDQKSSPNGLVRYAMPESCQWTPHFRAFMSRISKFPGVRFEIRICPSEQTTNFLIEGKIDFGFITGERLQPELRFEKFDDEHYSLVAADPRLFEPLKRTNSSAIRFISYPGWELFTSNWFKAFKIDGNFVKSILPVVTVGSLAGAIHAVRESAGVAILPSHCVEKDLKVGKLIAFGKNSNKSATLPIQLVRKVGKRLPRSVELVIETLKAAKKKSL